MFIHGDGSGWAKNHQQRPIRRACERARIESAISFHIFRHTYGSLLAREGVGESNSARSGLGKFLDRLTTGTAYST